MKIPKKLKVGGITYKIKNVNVINAGSDFVGLTDFDNARIELKKSSSKQVKEEVFLHEFFHIIFNHCNIEQDEHKVELLAQALHMVIKDNPDLFK